MDIWTACASKAKYLRLDLFFMTLRTRESVLVSYVLLSERILNIVTPQEKVK